MLDTNICSFVIRKRPLAVLDRLETAARRRDRIVISVVTFYELWNGAMAKTASPQLGALVSEFVGRLTNVSSWDTRAALAAARLRAVLRSAGTPIGENDAMIAGHALAENCVLVTNNPREFARVPDLRVEDWA
jgi:tRNA(fMet)-specific endonuclease VapC